VSQGQQQHRFCWRVPHGCRCSSIFAAVVLIVCRPLGLAAAEAPGNVDYADVLPRIAQQSPASARDTFLVQPGFELSLMAAEPLLASPVAIAWDENNRLFVAEMRGYSEDQDDHLGRIRLLHDEDGDGRPDRATVFADGLVWPTAVCCWDGGIFVGDAPDIIFLKDNDGDGVADQRQVVFTGFGTNNVQGLLNSFAFCLDGRIHGSASSNGGSIRRVGNDGEPVGPAVKLARRDFSFDPRLLDFRPETGGGQHGRSCDDAGNVYICSNSDHAIRVMLEDRFLNRNPDLAPPPARESIAVEGPQAAVFRQSPVEPWRVLRTRLRASGIVPGIVEGGGRPAGYFTSATGITLVRADACGDLRGMLVIGDVGSNVVHRKQLSSHGAGVQAARVDEGSELVASRDIWFRPVQFANAPDGGLWIIDMQREFIEHPASLPPAIKQHLDLTSGRETGRLWRLAAAGSSRPRMVPLGSATTAELVGLLDHANGWHRDTAFRLLLSRRDKATLPLARKLLGDPAVSGRGRLLAGFVLAGLEGLAAADVLLAIEATDPLVREAGVRLVEPLAAVGPLSDAVVDRLARLAAAEPAIEVRYRLAVVAGLLPPQPRLTVLKRLLARDGADRWCRLAAFTSLPPAAAAVIVDDWLDPAGDRLTVAARASLPGLFTQIARRNEPSELKQAVDGIAQLMRAATGPQELVAAAELYAALDTACGSHATAADEGSTVAAAVGRELASGCKQIVADATADPDLRRRAVPGLLFDSANLSAITRLIDPVEPPQLVQAAIAALGKTSAPEATAGLLEKLMAGDAAPVELLVEVLLATPARARALLEAIAVGRLAATVLSRQQAMALWRYPDNKVRLLAADVLGPPPAVDRGPLVAAYQASLQAGGDAVRGRQVFQQQCAACHRLGDTGRELGPSLAAARSRGSESLLLGILDPNREVLPAFVAHTAVTTGGRVVTGLITAESENSVSLQLADGSRQVLARDEIESLASNGRSLMPEGFERSIEPAAMADLLAFLMTAK
jgi:putative membrane-bound dehydrogenase-like protein